jgi:hypothetical protein
MRFHTKLPLPPFRWCGLMRADNHLVGNPRGRYDEHSSKFSLIKKPRFIEPVGKSQMSEGDAC